MSLLAHSMFLILFIIPLCLVNKYINPDLEDNGKDRHSAVPLMFSVFCYHGLRTVSLGNHFAALMLICYVVLGHLFTL